MSRTPSPPPSLNPVPPSATHEAGTAWSLLLLADIAIQQGKPDGLPEVHRPIWAKVREAFQHYEAQRDEQARQALQAIPLGSPFLEWKVLLRGLLAYSAQDDAKAIDNWQRLDPRRLPAKLAAPLRWQIDPTFRQTLPRQLQQQYCQQAMQLLPLPEALTKLARALHQTSLTSAFRLAEELVALWKSHPARVERLANLFYWQILDHGEPKDLSKFTQIFGPPKHDPKFMRLQALIYERQGQIVLANTYWHSYEHWIATQPTLWPGQMGELARAILWERMGRNALQYLQNGDDDEFDFIAQPLGGKRPTRLPLQPDHEACFRTSMRLAPDWPKPAVALFEYYLQQQQTDRAFAMAEELLARDPHHLGALNAMARVRCDRGEWEVALELTQRALATAPLDPQQRRQTSEIYERYIRQASAQKRFDRARQLLGSLRQLQLLDKTVMHLALECVLEQKAGNSARVEAIRQQLSANPVQQIQSLYCLAVEAIEQKLQTKGKSAYENDLQRLLDEQGSVMTLCALLTAAQWYRDAQVTYRGQATYQTKLHKWMDALIKTQPTPETLRALGEVLLAQNQVFRLRKIVKAGKELFPNNPWFCFFEAELKCIQWKAGQAELSTVWEAYQRAARLAKAKTSEYADLLARIDARQKQLPEMFTEFFSFL